MTSRDRASPKLKIAMILPGLGRVHRGAETGFIELGRALNKYPDLDIQLFGSGTDVPPGLKIHTLPVIKREFFERWPKLPVFRSENEYEEFSFTMSLILRKSRELRKFHIGFHCSFPFTNWFLQKLSRRGGPKPVYVTQNGDWPCRAESREYRSFHCAGLVCTRPDFYERHRDRYRCTSIPNGVDPQLFQPRSPDSFIGDPRIPANSKVVLMVSAFIPSKRVLDGIRAIAKVPETFLVLAGDGPERQAVMELAQKELPGRHLLLGSVRREQMPHWFKRADVFLHMSQDESFGIVYLEAASSGLAQVVHSSPTTQWILGETAIAVNTSDVGDVSEGLRAALVPDRANQLGRTARQRVLSDWTWEIQAEKYRNFFYQLQSSSSEISPCSRLSSSTTTPANIFASV
jgi:glycosyltransferase involved in cell wall biosynthesis